MHPFYFTIYSVLSYTLNIFYPKRIVINKPKKSTGGTIFVSNHPASFMDPLAIAYFGKFTVFFMARADVFTKMTTPFLSAVHMLPIYRQQDGENTKEKNKSVFQRCSDILKRRKNLLIFGEGFTDDTFIRRLKPVKKGAVRIGFQTLENINWEQNIYLSAIGCNYTDPSQLGSHLVLSYSDRICLNDYRALYEENPNKAINDLTGHIETLMQEQITHIKKAELSPFHEHIMIITRKGMNAFNYMKNLSLIKRWEYSKKLAVWINNQDLDANLALNKLKEQAESYFKLLSDSNLEEQFVFWKKENPNGGRLKEVMYILLLSPFAILGAIHCAPTYLFIKRFVEKSFKRKVFWASVKMLLGAIVLGIINIPAIFIFYYFVFPSWILAIAYYFSIGLTGLAAYKLVQNYKAFVIKGKVNKVDLTEVLQQREMLEKIIQETVPNF